MIHIDNKNYLVVDQFGNLVEGMVAVPIGSVVRTPDDVVEWHETAKRRKEQQFRKRSNDPFTFYMVSAADKLRNLKPQTVTRLFYLSTFLSYDNNVLYFKGNQKLNKTNMADLLKVSPSVSSEFVAELSDAGILIKDGDSLTLDADMFRRGKICDPANNHAVRIRHYGIRALYDMNSANNHKRIGYVFKAMANMNIEWNILCSNVREGERSAIRPISSQDFCDVAGYNRTKAHRLIRDLSEVRFPCKGFDQRFCSTFYDEVSDDHILVVNPFVVFAGYDDTLVEEFGSFLKEAKQYRESKKERSVSADD